MGLDIGGTDIKGGVLDRDGQLLKYYKCPTRAKLGKKAILASIDDVVRTLLDAYPNCIGIGIGTAGRVNVDQGSIEYATDNLPGWQGTHLKEIMETTFKRPSIVDNDANAGLIGELWNHPNLQAASSVVMLTLGTGVGGAASFGQKLVRGAHWNGNEWGHSILVPGGRICNCGKQGCAEQYVSGTALLKEAARKKKTYVHGANIFEDYLLGDPEAVQLVKEFIYYLTILLSNISVTLDPSDVILGGGLIYSKEVWWPLLEQEVKSLNLPIQLHPARLGNQAGLIGGAKLLLDSLKESDRSGIQPQPCLDL